MPLKTLALIGFLLSLYALYIKKKSQNKNYKALCDINENISCTQVLTSKYASLIYLPNSLLGLIFYTLIYLLVSLNFLTYVFYLSLISLLVSLYLAYLLYFKVKKTCLICSLTYLVNLLLLIFSLQQII
jgi:vitamin-K-epoxide reductase (warfarin-sensitive)